MKCAPGSSRKRIFVQRLIWRRALAAGLLCWLAMLFSLIMVAPPPAFAASRLSAKQTFAISPTQGPVGTVIAVTGTDLIYPDGTQINLGYTTNFSNCVAASESQGGTVKNQAFSGWLRWPASTGTGNFGVCVIVTGHSSFLVGNFNVLSASPPQVTIAPGVPSAAQAATVTGANFLPDGVTVNLLWQSVTTGQTFSLGSVTSDNTGAFTQTFTVPAKTSTGSYSITATSGTQQPPTLSSSITFHVDGVSVAPAPTAGTQPAPTATANRSAALPTATVARTPLANSTGTSNTTAPGASDKSGLLTPLIIGGVLVIVLALIAGVLLVRRQRSLAQIPMSNAADPLPAFVAGGGAGFPLAAGYPPGPQISSGPLGANRPVQPGGQGVSQSAGAIPFDADLADAMRQAQVGLFAMPRPPIGEEVLSQ